MRLSSVFIATFSHYEKGERMPRNGMVEPLLSFFLPKVNMLLLLDQPHVISDSIDPIIALYIGKKLHKKFTIHSFFYLPIYILCKIPSKNKTRIVYKLRDLFSVLYIGLTRRDVYDIFVGLEAINALGGIILKRLGKVKTVIYYVSDYSPTRFGINWFNGLYIWLDKFCVKHADFTWDVSFAMKEARIDAGLSLKFTKNIIHVPNGLFPSQIDSLPIQQRKPNSLVYLGSLTPEFGIDMAIKALKIIKQKIPNVSLDVIGGGKDRTRLELLAEKMHVRKQIVFYGFIPDNQKMANVVKKCFIGIAPYLSGDLTSRWYGWYGDAGKIRQYLASGLPVVTTQVPPLGKYVVKKGAALMAKDTQKDFSNQVIKLLQNKKLYRKLSYTAKELSKENTWENSYKKAFEEMEQRV